MVSPVKAILAMRGLEASGLPASTPKPLTTLSTPGGSKSPMRSISTMMENGVCSAGFSTTPKITISHLRPEPDEIAHAAEGLRPLARFRRDLTGICWCMRSPEAG